MSIPNGTLAKKSVGQQIKETLIKDNPRSTVAVWVTLLYLCFQLYRTFINPMVPMLVRPIHVSSIGFLCVLLNPGKHKSKGGRIFDSVCDWFVFTTFFYHIWYALSQFERLGLRVNYLDPVNLIDIIECVTLIILIMIGIARTVGLTLAIFIGVFITYAWTAKWLPGILYYGGMNLNKFTDLMVMGSEGIYGTATGAGSGFMYWIMIFGSLFGTCGGGQVLIDIGIKFGAKSKDNSGPAKAAVMASGLMGMISGSAAANVAGTGVMTIPMMKRVGYAPEEAGAIEAAASTGGQIMPPIMGTGAFLMAEMLGISYMAICKAAIIPAAMYYLAIFLLVHMLAKKRRSAGEEVEMELECEPILPRLYLLSPIVVLVAAIAYGCTLQRSALYGIAAILVLNVISPKMRYGPIHIIQQVLNATRLSSNTSQPISGCGIIIGIVSISGLATRLSSVISSFGGEMMWVGLIITMLGCMLLGMALPTVAAYLTAYVLFIPTLKGLGISTLAANMFIFYFGIFAQITPPVCIASYTAAGIAEAKPWDTGWRGMVYASVAFFAPFAFVYEPGILMDGSIIDILHDTGILALGTAMLVFAVAGYFMTNLPLWQRLLLVVGGICTCIPEGFTDLLGLSIGAAVVVLQIIKHRHVRKETASAVPQQKVVKRIVADTSEVNLDEE
ncbi:TRAP transporter permease [Pseudoflavonifractor phocaeensis]|uniref:TRAP transporter permease n=1 Tax=Pseudoflavonifractor phocaeensis TaxID=1870988 RepID=UPI0021099B38|nr:TRAP transporter fused permease subunit [Pseudoflavonifractor phocaeensis]MCQ4864642.1 TRAP transporter fused permease subunit [Pseudoflavonifractor phocaeensis]